MRCIDADALIRKAEHEAEGMDEPFKSNFAVLVEWLIEKTPTIEPEHKKGKWIHDGYDFPHGNDWIHCSICGKRDINVPASLTNFCPNCGADMRGEEDV